MANINRNPETRPEPYQSDDFIYWAPAAHPDPPGEDPDEPFDPVAHSNLLRAALFGLTPKPPASDQPTI